MSLRPWALHICAVEASGWGTGSPTLLLAGMLIWALSNSAQAHLRGSEIMLVMIIIFYRNHLLSWAREFYLLQLFLFCPPRRWGSAVTELSARGERVLFSHLETCSHMLPSRSLISSSVQKLSARSVSWSAGQARKGVGFQLSSEDTKS